MGNHCTSFFHYPRCDSPPTGLRPELRPTCQRLRGSGVAARPERLAGKQTERAAVEHNLKAGHVRPYIRVPTLSAHDLGDVLGGGHGHALRHVLRLLGAVVGRRREAERARQRVARRQALAEVQHAQLERELEGALVLHQAPAAQLPEQTRRHLHLGRNLGGSGEVSLSCHWSKFSVAIVASAASS